MRITYMQIGYKNIYATQDYFLSNKYTFRKRVGSKANCYCVRNRKRH